MIRNVLLVILFILVPFGYAFYVYPGLPQTIPTHFNASGEADAWGDKSTIYLLPTIMGIASIVVFLVLSNIKKLDPKRYANADDILYKKFALFTVLFLSVLSLVIIYSTANAGIKLEKMIFPLLGVAFAVLGYFMPKLKQNYFAGIRLPWTLDSEPNWIATHQVAGKVWTIGGGLQFVFSLLLKGEIVFYVFMFLIILMVFVPTVYSYLFFKKEKAGR
jgi:hypothetical protein